MIDYLLVFALGVSVTLLLALIVTPAIYRRVVYLTEKRMRATVPLTTAEVRAERDVARAAFAMENRKLSVELDRRRERITALMVETDRLGRAVAMLEAKGRDQAHQIEHMNSEAGDLRSEVKDGEERIERLKDALARTEDVVSVQERRLADMAARIERLEADADAARIDLATRETEVESLKAQIGTLRDERAKLRDDVKKAEEGARETALRLVREEQRAAALDARLSTAIADLSDRDTTLDRRQGEIERLKARLKSGRQAARGQRASTASGSGGDESTASDDGRNQGAGTMTKTGTETAELLRRPDIAERIERLRARQATLVDRLNAAAEEQDDRSLRGEIAEIAAMMVELTAVREGDASPIPALLEKARDEPRRADGPSLAERSLARMEAERPTTTHS